MPVAALLLFGQTKSRTLFCAGPTLNYDFSSFRHHHLNLVWAVMAVRM